jgi:hypothetical protein
MVLLVLGVCALFVLHQGLKFLRLKGKDILNIDRLLYYQGTDFGTIEQRTKKVQEKIDL